MHAYINQHVDARHTLKVGTDVVKYLIRRNKDNTVNNNNTSEVVLWLQRQ